MNLVYVLLGIAIVMFLLMLILSWNYYDTVAVIVGVVNITLISGLLITLLAVADNIKSKHDWYMETRLKYAESEGIEKEYLEMNDVMTYNLWYERNKADLENPWNLKNAAGCEFDYIKIKGD